MLLQSNEYGFDYFSNINLTYWCSAMTYEEINFCFQCSIMQQFFICFYGGYSE